MKRKALDDHNLTQDYDALVHPWQVFDHPSDVVNDPDLSLNEKRALLVSWASDACAIEAAPGLRKVPAGRVVQFEDIMDALRILDKEVAGTQPVCPQSARASLPRVNARGLRKRAMAA